MSLENLIPDLDFEELFSVDFLPYDELVLTDVLRESPRFGYSNKFADLFSSSDDRIDYIIGISIFSAIFLVIVLVWAILLLIFKCLGPDRVGFLSGEAFEKPGRVTGCYCRAFLSRVLFLLSCGCFVVSAYLFNTQGMQYVYNVAETSADAILDVTNYSAKAVDTLIDISTFASDSEVVAAEFNFLLEDDEGRQCLLGTDEFVSAGGQGILQDVEIVLSNLNNFLPDDHEELTKLSDSLYDRAEKLGDPTNVTEEAKLYVLIATIFYIATAAILFLGVVLASLNIDLPFVRCCLSWVILPLFCLQVVIASILTCLQVVNTANADFCSGGQNQTPEGTIYEILLNLGVEENSDGLKILDFYINQCSADFPFQVIENYYTQLAGSAPSFQDLDGALNRSIGDFASRKLAQVASAFCLDFVNQFQQVTEDVLTNLVSLAEIVADIFDLIRCDTIVPVYTRLVYNGSCDQTITGLTWLVGCFLGMAISGMLMITLRASWQLTTSEEDYIIHGDRKYVEETSPSSAHHRKVDNRSVATPYARAQYVGDVYESDVSA